MGKKDSAYLVVYRGDTVDYIRPGAWVFFQRPLNCGGGYWLGRAYDDVFIIEYERPTSLFDGIRFLMLSNEVQSNSHVFDDDFRLT